MNTKFDNEETRIFKCNLKLNGKPNLDNPIVEIENLVSLFKDPNLEVEKDMKQHT